MSKLTRVTQKIFGSTAGVDEIGEFGSFAAGTPTFTTDPAVIQSLSNYLEGWFAAVLGDNSPCIEDWNAICFLFARQLAYLFQAGIPEWDSGTTYFIGSLVNSGGIIFKSLTDNNLNNAVTDTTNWKPPVSPSFNAILGSAAQVTAGTATHSTWSSAIAALSAGQTLFVLPGSWTENVTVDKTLKIIGAGHGSLITGSMTLTSAADYCIIRDLYFTDSITLNSGADGNKMDGIFLAVGKTFVDNGTGNLLEAIEV